MFNIFGSKSVDDVLSTFNKAVDDLRAIKDDNYGKAADKTDTISRLKAEITEHEAEAKRADSVAQKISDLIS